MTTRHPGAAPLLVSRCGGVTRSHFRRQKLQSPIGGRVMTMDLFGVKMGDSKSSPLLSVASADAIPMTTATRSTHHG